jgi:hypothetical protein
VGEVKIYEGKPKVFMIRFTSQFSVTDYYQPSVIVFVHVHMKQFYEQAREVITE